MEDDMQEVLFIHSAGPQSETEGSGPFLHALRDQLEPGFVVHAPLMPDPDSPDAGPWLEALGRHLGELRAPFVLAGHSLGGSIILKFLAENPIPPLLAGVVSVAAPLWGAPDWGVPEFALPPTAGAALAEVRRLVLYHSRDDEIVAFDHLDRYAGLLPHAVVRPVDGRGHGFENGDSADVAADIREFAAGAMQEA
jgi:predicted alpha/beta hydrolase family esterase